MSIKKKKIGRYSIQDVIGKGGMGEVFLAYDPVCERRVALKCIREDLLEKKAIRSRFLREARIAAKLTHPSILPIYTIHSEEEKLYYTMTYIEGETLREIIKRTREQEKKGKKLHPIGGNISALCRIFLSVCEAVSYSHSHEILHRDLKPDNILIGKYGEVMIFDWGIADHIDAFPKDKVTDKVAGTVAYMAPERGKGHIATVQTEIYSLGVILYQILTLELPFRRGNLEAFRKTMDDEELINPIEFAPYREIPRELVDIVKKALEPLPESRYNNVDEMISDLKDAIEGKSEWLFSASLDPNTSDDWEFQENILLAKHTAISRNIDLMEWVGLMISKESFSGNIRMQAKVTIEKNGSGVGFLLGVPEGPKRRSLEEGYCLWLGVKPQSKLQLFRSGILLVEVEKEIQLNKANTLIIEKAHDQLRCFLNGELIFSHTSHLPLMGAHLGLLHKDSDFSLKEIEVFSGSHNLMVGCLAVPDAFFAHKKYDIALAEYRRIARSFPGRAEGRNALFKAGITLLEKGKGHKEKQKILHSALDEFEKLHNTQGAPLEYLGKSLVYKEFSDSIEEIKCLEYALRKFPKHPLLSVLEEYIIYRMHESTTEQREIAYRLILLVSRYFPKKLLSKDTKDLIQSLKNSWEELYFIEDSFDEGPSFAIQLSITLAFWTDKKQLLIEMIELLIKKEPLDQINIENALFALSEMGAYQEVKTLITKLTTKKNKEFSRALLLIKSTLAESDSGLKSLFENSSKHLHKKELRALFHILKKMLLNKEYEKIYQIQKFIASFDLENKIFLDSLFLWNLLLKKDLKAAEKIVHAYDQEAFSDEYSPLYAPYGAYLYLTKGPDKTIAHFSSLLDSSYPPTTSLISHYLHGKITLKDSWYKEAFTYEKEELYLSLVLFYRAIEKEEQAKPFERKIHVRFTRNHRKKNRP